MNLKPINERRKYARTMIDIDILCALRDLSKWLDIYTVRAKNICRKGMFLQTQEILHPGTDIYLQFYLPQQSVVHFTIRAKIIWNRFDEIVQGLGVYFTDIGSKYEEIIDHFVLKHYPFGSPPTSKI